MRRLVMKQTERSTLEMALVGYEAERQRIKAAMAAILRHVGEPVRGGAVLAVVGEARPKRILSAAAKRRMAAAQRKRWAAFQVAQERGTVKGTAPGPCRDE
jgi:hypothetical protein